METQGSLKRPNSPLSEDFDIQDYDIDENISDVEEDYNKMLEQDE